MTKGNLQSLKLLAGPAVLLAIAANPLTSSVVKSQGICKPSFTVREAACASGPLIKTYVTISSDCECPVDVTIRFADGGALYVGTVRKGAPTSEFAVSDCRRTAVVIRELTGRPQCPHQSSDRAAPSGGGAGANRSVQQRLAARRQQHQAGGNPENAATAARQITQEDVEKARQKARDDERKMREEKLAIERELRLEQQRKDQIRREEDARREPPVIGRTYGSPMDECVAHLRAFAHSEGVDLDRVARWNHFLRDLDRLAPNWRTGAVRRVMWLRMSDMCSPAANYTSSERVLACRDQVYICAQRDGWNLRTNEPG